MSYGHFYLAVWAGVWFLILASSLFAIFRGGWPERLGGMLVLGMAVIFGIADEISAASIEVKLFLDGILALGFLALAIRFALLWVGTALLLQAAQFSLQAFYFVTDRSHDGVYAVVNNVITVSVLLALAAGTVMHRRRVAEFRRSALPAAS